MVKQCPIKHTSFSSKRKNNVLHWAFKLNRVLHETQSWHLECCMLNTILQVNAYMGEETTKIDQAGVTEIKTIPRNALGNISELLHLLFPQLQFTLNKSLFWIDKERGLYMVMDFQLLFMFKPQQFQTWIRQLAQILDFILDRQIIP